MDEKQKTKKRSFYLGPLNNKRMLIKASDTFKLKNSNNKNTQSTKNTTPHRKVVKYFVLPFVRVVEMIVKHGLV